MDQVHVWWDHVTFNEPGTKLNSNPGFETYSSTYSELKESPCVAVSITILLYGHMEQNSNYHNYSMRFLFGSAVTVGKNLQNLLGKCMCGHTFTHKCYYSLFQSAGFWIRRLQQPLAVGSDGGSCWWSEWVCGGGDRRDACVRVVGVLRVIGWTTAHPLCCKSGGICWPLWVPACSLSRELREGISAPQSRWLAGFFLIILSGFLFSSFILRLFSLSLRFVLDTVHSQPRPAIV